MPTLVLSLFRLLRLLFSGHGAFAMENTALRVQLIAFQRKRKRPTLTCFDRRSGWGCPCCGLAGALPGLRPSRHGRPLAARTVPQVLGSAVEIRLFIEWMDAATLCGVHPGFMASRKCSVSRFPNATVSRILRRLPRPPGQTCKTFQRNHLGQMVRQPRPRLPSRLSKKLRRTRSSALSAAGFGTAFMAPTFGRVSLRSKSKKCPHSAPQPLAESIRRAADRLDAQRVSGPLHHP
jgi:hypothetical protein